MARPQQRFRGENKNLARDFETEDAARAYDEAARLMCVRARTNFPYNPNAVPSSSSKLLSATLTAKLHKCYMASLQLTKQTQTQSQAQAQNPRPRSFSLPDNNMTTGGNHYNREEERRQ
ncbi:hypothetical protein Bca52824_092037 [Brassica carinata]|uniref:AP2/ERF domain-containing protein n=1 Tax=Brassica carinata TaxID=52824 RepID=A0A8X7NSE7_BRACI|nr:hypothetical protein Bca52824_092037 [Brassica carinata]